MKNDNYQLHSGDCLELLATLPDNSVDSIVTDPPYGLSFMGKKWDYDVPKVEIWKECLRVLKPGGHLLAFAGTRTQHRMAVRIEDAGFEIRDMIAWVYGSGFPKSHNIAVHMDRMTGVLRKGERGNGYRYGNADPRKHLGTATSNKAHQAISDTAKQWQGWGTALKPALEPITVARKPLVGTVAENVLTHGTGAINIDATRISADGRPLLVGDYKKTADNVYEGRKDGSLMGGSKAVGSTDLGRWPANLIHDGSEEVTGLFPGEEGKSAARFFYCAKASKKDRDEGLDGFEAKSRPTMGNGIGGQPDQQKANNRNVHPTVKPTELMRYLCRLVTPPGGVVLDPFTGSGSTGKAAILEGFRFLGAEMNPEYVAIAKARIESAVSLL